MEYKQSLVNLMRIAKTSDATIMITGETGTGKSSLARQIHDSSHRKNKPFVVVNLAALHEGTLESELFGHERGAFTGADQRRTGRLELAAGGTVFLDEIGELSLRLQARLLEFIQSRKITPVGGNREIQLDVRVIAATHRDVWAASLKGEFREDLLHRLCVVSIPLQSLRDRSEEFGDFVHSFLMESARNAGKTILKISPAVAEIFESSAWLGNFRELRNVLEYAVLSCEGQEIRVSDLPYSFLRGSQSRSSQSRGDKSSSSPSPTLGMAESPFSLSYYESTASYEKAYLIHSLEKNLWRVNTTARQIGINKTTLIRRMREHGLSSDSRQERVLLA